MKAFLVTNNPMVERKLSQYIEVEYREEGLLDLFNRVRDKTHKGSVLLTHPLSGSVKPGETPYKTVMMREEEGNTDFASVALIESAIATAEKLMRHRNRRAELLTERQLDDFQVIDYTLIISAFPSAGIELNQF